LNQIRWRSRIFVATTVICLATVMRAQVLAQQPEVPVTWSLVATVAPRAAGRVHARLTASIAQGWHLYSISQPEGGPNATEINLDPKSPYQLTGPIAGPPPTSAFDPNFRIRTEFYTDSAAFDLPLSVHKKAEPLAPIVVMVRYQACSRRLCTQPLHATAGATPMRASATVAPPLRSKNQSRFRPDGARLNHSGKN